MSCLEARGRDFDTMYSVSSLLRDLGAQSESRELMLELYDASLTEEEKYAAADFLSFSSMTWTRESSG